MINNAKHITKCINHWAYSANSKDVTLDKIYSGLTGKSFEMPNASYTNRWQQLRKPQTDKLLWLELNNHQTDTEV